jgi:ATP-dependent Clp protease ATP-binding subunit ClpA
MRRVQRAAAGAGRRAADDGQGRTVDFTNTIIILTSNLGSQYLASLTDDEQVDKVEPQVMEVVRGHFRPEFLNRLDEIILFHRLAADHMGPIVDIQIARLGKLLADRKIRLELSDGAARGWAGSAMIRSTAPGRSSARCRNICRTRWPTPCCAAR